MCICCCLSRKSLLIYAIVISIISFIYGIAAISQFASKTEVYKYLIERIELYEKNKDLYQDSRRLDSYYDRYNDNIGMHVLNSESLLKIYQLSSDDFENNPYGLIKRLKGLENGLGTILFIFPIIFLAAEIAYIVFACGISENQVLKVKTYFVLNIFKIITYTLSIIFIFLAIFYGAMLFAILMEYMMLVDNFDSCSSKIVIGMFFGYYSFWYYITLACIFGRERKLFMEVGTEANPGIRAQYDLNGAPLVRAVVAPQIIGINAVTPQMIVQPVNIAPYQQYPQQQVQVYNQQQQPSQLAQPSVDKLQKPEEQVEIQRQSQRNNSTSRKIHN